MCLTAQPVMGPNLLSRTPWLFASLPSLPYSDPALHHWPQLNLSDALAIPARSSTVCTADCLQEPLDNCVQNAGGVTCEVQVCAADTVCLQLLLLALLIHYLEVQESAASPSQPVNFAVLSSIGEAVES